MNLSETINYQPNSIVSKILLKNDSGNTTLFAIDEGEIISKHTSPFLAAIYCIEGNLKIGIGEEIFTISNNDFIKLPETIPHSVEAIKKSKFLLLMFK